MLKKKIVIIDENDGRALLLIDALKEAGFDVVGRFTADINILATIDKLDVDLLILNMNMLDKHLLKQLQSINDYRPMPIVIFADKGETTIINEAVKAGVSAFVIDGLAAKRIKPVLDVAIARFTKTQELYKELQKTRDDVEHSKIVNRAKLIIMNTRKIDEDTAYRELRSMAMNQNMRIHEVAKNLVNFSKLLKQE